MKIVLQDIPPHVVREFFTDLFATEAKITVGVNGRSIAAGDISGIKFVEAGIEIHLKPPPTRLPNGDWSGIGPKKV